MQKKQKSTSRLRKVFIFSIVACFVFFAIVFVYQYSSYKRIEDRINAAYSASYSKSSSTYKLFSTFSEAENLFRLYTVDFSKKNYLAYKEKIDTIKFFIDSIAELPLENNPLVNGKQNLALSKSFATEFVSIKRDIDKLVLFASDSLTHLTETSNTLNTNRKSYHNADSVISQIMKDSLENDVNQDTIVKARQNLFNRIFNSKNDTLVSHSSREILNTKQLDIVHRNIEHLITTNEKIYNKNLRDLRRAFLKMQSKERELVLSNYSLINNLKSGIDKLKEIEIAHVREVEAKDFSLYRASFQLFVNQLILAFVIMLLMMIFIFYFQYKVNSFESKLLLEKEYASKIAEEKTSILANISHEIRSPLNSLKGIIDIIKNNNKANLIDKEIIQTVDNDISVINSTVNDILSLSKLEADSLEIKQEYFSPYTLIEEVIGLHKYQSQIKGLQYINDNKINPSLSIYNNAFRIKQVVSNLISNAIKYTKEGSITVKSEIVTTNGLQKLVIQVKDTGIGIANDKKDQVFRKYYVADSKNRSGFGLGLYISKILSEQIDGDISFTSKLNIGSVFTFELPLKKDHIAIQDKKEFTVSDLDQNLNLIIIDDSRISLFFIQQLFKDRHNVHYFNSSSRAAEHILTNPVDIIITDLLMPEISGWEILGRVRSNDTLKHIKVFASTAEPMLLEDKTKQEWKFDGVIPKPINENELVANLLKS